MRRRVGLRVLGLFFVLGPLVASGSVIQVDGTIIPVLDNGNDCASNVQVCINQEEGFVPPNVQAIDVIREASLLPEVFLPDTSKLVSFKDIGEGAGFENSFGYYNVGDNITNTANLHPILGCGVPANAHAGEAQGYVQNAEPGSVGQINFAVEKNSGRYKGGFIGFYLITPEGNPGETGNCGDFAGANRFFGKIYFTQRDLNNDGDFVHSLVWQSNRIDKPDRFYFGFEDLFRGGDNDYEDMAIQVEGLTPPCQPVAETCNNRDDDCDGIVDDSPTDVGQSCAEGIGACLDTGVTVCAVGGVIDCNATPGAPIGEICNNIDDNCNGLVDDSPVDIGDACTVGVGECFETGVTVCQGGFEVCGATAGSPVGELCDGLDNDCDGLFDEDFGVGNACEGVGECGPGVLECASATTVRCSTNVGGSQDQAQTEICNGLDDDCDGQTDEGAVDVGESCTVGVGICERTGSTICAGGLEVCNVAPGASQPELCDGLDNDCDGQTDEDFGVGLVCDGIGECGVGVLECRSTTSAGCSTDVGGSQDQSQPESCDGLDNDCDGRLDDGLNDLGPCGLSDVGECQDGRLRCSAGQVECVGEIGPTPEVCDGLDNDCNGQLDNNPIDEGEVCGSDVGECSFGANVCLGGALQCVNEVGPQPELCDGLDNDCNGVSDNDLADPALDQSCGEDTGECDAGVTQCLGGQVLCVGGAGPQNEVCDGLDNDCNGLVDDNPEDVGQPCGSTFGICSPGITECVPDPNDADGDGVLGEIECNGGVNPGLLETCNGQDDDCDGVIDDNTIDSGGPCGTDEGECVAGTLACSAGQLICQGSLGPFTEICNGLDDDCDGQIDEELAGDPPLCAAPTECIQGACRLPCDTKTSRCAGGEFCFDEDNNGFGFCLPNPCADVTCEDPEVCDALDGQCKLPCELSPCQDGFFCDVDGECKEDNCYGRGCPEGELCLDAACVPDPCLGVPCGADEFCREGQCVPSCEGVSCAPQERCVDGVCEPDPCFGVECEEGELCVPETGQCSDLCQFVVCGDGRVCDPASGQCIDDPCTGVVCSDDGICEDGQCTDETPDGFVTAGGGCGVAPSSGGGALLLLALLATGLLFWRRRVLLFLSLFFGGCILDPFFFGGGGRPCELTNNGVEICDQVDNDCDGRIDDNCQQNCTPTNGGVEVCDGVDNDCNGQVDDNCVGCVSTNNGIERCDEIDNDCDDEIDEGFELTSDVRNCGECGNQCAFEGAFARCENSQCVFDGCAPGHVDIDNDPLTCEYLCSPINGGSEACDTLDNDCDGLVDEDTDLQNDPNNCGQCGRVCAFFQADPSCEAAQCTFDPQTDCRVLVNQTTGEATQFHDIDGDPDTGCEYACNPNPLDADPSEPETLCNGLDDDCDGARDDGLDLDVDPQNCGRCGRVCAFPNVPSPSCVTGICGFDPQTDCAPNTFDIDSNPNNGCEYACVVANGGVELCNGQDDDCDGVADNNLADPALNQACGAPNVGACAPGVTICQAGAPRCVGAQGPRAERCDNIDNDCDGQTDELADLIDVGRVCAASIGECSFGLTSCNPGGALVCERQVGPAPEVCDGLDNDCDGFIDASDTDSDGTADELPVDTAQPCGGGQFNGGQSQCQEGVTTCNVGILECVGNTDPTPEVCDSVDNDCNGQVDDNPAQVGSACGSNLGECDQGTFACVAGALTCQGEVGPSPELCDGLDNDCSGLPDDNLSDPDVGDSCGATGVGSCELGTQICSGGQLICAGEVGPIGESCNGQDDDCDGTTDEANAGGSLSQSCYGGPSGTQGVGVCRAGVATCTNGTFANAACAGQILPSVEVCDGQDDDCDGTTDEANVGGPLTQSCYSGPSGTQGVGVCRAGAQTCSGGAFGACIGEVTPQAEICGDSLNNDCDGNVSDASEGCLTAQGAADFRADSIQGNGQNSNAGQHHSFDVDVATSGNNVFVVFSDNRNTTGPNNVPVPRVFLARSTDGGQTFANTLTLVSDNTNRCDTNNDNAIDGLCAAVAPQVVAVGNTVIVGYVQLRNNQTRDVFVAISVDGGQTFNNNRRVRMDADNNTADAFHFDLDAIQSGANVKGAVAWEELDTANAALPRRVKVRRTKNAGANNPAFDAEQIANKGAGNPIAGRPQLVFSNTDRILVVWREQRQGGNGTTDVFRNFWEDAQAAINATDLRLDTDPAAGASDDVPVIARVGGEIYVAWEDLKADGADITFVRSTNNGDSFGAELTLDDPAGEVSTSLSPAITAVSVGAGQNRVYVAWEDDRDGTEVFVARSLDSGQSFGGALRASSIINPTPGVSLEPRIIADAAGRVAVSFTSDRSGFEDVLVGFSLDAGATWQPRDVRADADVQGAGASVSPRLALLSAGVGVAWTDFRTNGINGDVFFRRVTP